MYHQRYTGGGGADSLIYLDFFSVTNTNETHAHIYYLKITLKGFKTYDAYGVSTRFDKKSRFINDIYMHKDPPLYLCRK